MNSVATLEVRSHPDCLCHRPGLGHPDSPDRLRAVLEALETEPHGWTVRAAAPLPAADTVAGALHWIHTAAYLERLRAAIGQPPGWLDSEDCRVAEGSWEAVIASAGLALQAALDIANGRVERVVLALRPPSANAAADRAAGYCLVNSVALAAEVLVRCWRLPVVVADFDVLHGGGTQQIFWQRGDVGVVSVHRYPFFPGSGGGDETGADAGAGATLNVPLAAGADDEVYAIAFERALTEMAARLRPAAIVLAAGFGAHQADPIGGMQVTEAGFRRMTAAAVRVAREHCRGRVLSLLEGGWNVAATASAARAHAEELAEMPRVGVVAGDTVH